MARERLKKGWHKEVKPAERRYRGADNPNNPHSTGKHGSVPETPVVLVPVKKGDKTQGGRRSRRVRKNKWVHA